ncbi:T9SS type A sorting domain-containing protein [Paenimyroides baculatum]|uniref:T9SS type A sorting domain-containing protein n=1 Tax=Paenimyroides baculatum TaxID=2608000 RepID=A0A5M6CAE7_9FLAO|nr:T9SS type A sorting domain-containing protein [Paenimyroides baculatum]KAA5531961.1 T9SS type A sorting domain-containing protein [Paenimyroides baculatum]
MKKIFTLTAFLTILAANAQFTSGNVTLGSTGMVVKLETNATTATITLTGNSNSYLGIGFGSAGMDNGSDGFIYNSQSNLDYTFAGVGSNPVADVTQHWTVSSNTVASGIRTIVATRTLAGGTEDYTIANAAGNISISYARGTGLSLANHGTSRGYSTLVMKASLSTEDFDQQKIKVYPNPVTDLLHFGENGTIKKVSFYDTTGRMIKTTLTEGKSSIDVSTLAKGTYVVEYELTDGSISYDKIVKK